MDSTGKIHFVSAGTATIAVQTAATANHLAETKSMSMTVNSAIVAPTVPSNIPTSFNVNSDNGNINLAAYMQAGWTIQVVSVGDPGAVNGA